MRRIEKTVIEAADELRLNNLKELLSKNKDNKNINLYLKKYRSLVEYHSKKTALKFKVDPGDLMTVGYLGVMRAAVKELDTGLPIKRYIAWCVKRAVAEEAARVRFGQSLNTFRVVSKAGEVYNKKVGIDKIRELRDSGPDPFEIVANKEQDLLLKTALRDTKYGECWLDETKNISKKLNICGSEVKRRRAVCAGEIKKELRKLTGRG